MVCSEVTGPYHVAVVAGVLLLAAVPGDVAGSVTLVTAVLLLATLNRPGLSLCRAGCLDIYLPSKVAEPVALVALLAATSTAEATEATASTTTSAATATWRKRRFNEQNKNANDD